MAENYFRQALKKNPEWLPALGGLLQISLKQARYVQGKAYLQRYVALNRHTHTADTLWAGYRIEKNMGNREAAANYAVRLKSRFPDSPQTVLLLKDMARK